MNIKRKMFAAAAGVLLTSLSLTGLSFAGFASNLVSSTEQKSIDSISAAPARALAQVLLSTQTQHILPPSKSISEIVKILKVRGPTTSAFASNSENDELLFDLSTVNENNSSCTTSNLEVECCNEELRTCTISEAHPFDTLSENEDLTVDEDVDPSDSDFSFVDDEVEPEASFWEGEQVYYPLPLTPEEEVAAERTWSELSNNFILKNAGKTWSTFSPDGFTECFETYDSRICHSKGDRQIFEMQATFLPDYLLPEVPLKAQLALSKVHPLGNIQKWGVTLIDGQWCLVGYNTKVIQAYDPTDGSVKSYPLVRIDGKLALTEAQDISH